MSRIRLYLDEDAFARRLVTAHRSRGIDVMTALDAKMINRDDEEHLEFATAQRRALYSFNSPDFAGYMRNGYWLGDRMPDRHWPATTIRGRAPVDFLLALGCGQIG